MTEVWSMRVNGVALHVQGALDDERAKQQLQDAARHYGLYVEMWPGESASTPRRKSMEEAEALVAAYQPITPQRLAELLYRVSPTDKIAYNRIMVMLIRMESVGRVVKRYIDGKMVIFIADAPQAAYYATTRYGVAPAQPSATLREAIWGGLDPDDAAHAAERVKSLWTALAALGCTATSNVGSAFQALIAAMRGY